MSALPLLTTCCARPDIAAHAVIWYFYLKGFEVGCLELTYPDGHTEVYGDVDNASFQAAIIVHSRAAFRRMVLGETVGLAEAYMRAEWWASLACLPACPGTLP